MIIDYKHQKLDENTQNDIVDLVNKGIIDQGYPDQFLY